nr:hypothetical protein [Tanacetum cinerariifolium]
DEYLEPSRAERPDSPAQAVQVSVTSADKPLSTTIDQDAPSLHISPSSSALQSHSLPTGVVVEPHFMEDHNVAPVDNNPFLTEKVSVLQEQNELFRVENEKVKQHYKELYDSINITRAKHIDQTTSMLTENENLKVQINAKLKCVTIDFVTPKVLAPGIYAIDVEPIPPRLRNNKEVHLDYLKHLKKSVATLREMVEEAKVERPLDKSVASACLYTKHSQELLEHVINIVLWYLDSGCSKHMTGDRSRLKNFVKKFFRTVRFGNDHFGTIIGQFYDSDLEVAFRKHSCYVRDTDAVATVCYTQNRSLIHTRYNKTPYELVHNKKHDLNFLCVFGALCYPINDIEDLSKLQPTADIEIFVGYAPSRKGYRIYNKRTQRIIETIHIQFDELFAAIDPVQLSTGPAFLFLTPGQISSGLIPNLFLAAPYVPPTNKDLEILFQPMFDEHLEPPRVDKPISPTPAVLVPVNLAGTPSSTTIDQDAPSPSHSPSSSALQSLCLHHGVAPESTLMDENPFAPVDNDPFINIFAPEPTSVASSSGDASSTNSTYITQTLHHIGK